MFQYKEIILLTLLFFGFGKGVKSATLGCGLSAYVVTSPMETISLYENHVWDRTRTCTWEILPALGNSLSFQITSLQLLPGCRGKLTIYDETGAAIIDTCQVETRSIYNTPKSFKKLKIRLTLASSYHYHNSIQSSQLSILFKLHKEYADCDMVHSSNVSDNKAPITIYRPADLLEMNFKDKACKGGSGCDNYVGEVISSRLGTTICDRKSIILPSTETPSCHAASNKSCEWVPISGIKNVTERTDLYGGRQLKVSSDKAEFRTKSKSLQMDKVCLLIEYVNGPNGNNASHQENATAQVVLKMLTDNGSLSSNLVHEILERVDTWTVVRLIQDVPRSNSSSYQLAVELTNAHGIYINKLYGCNPYKEEERTLFSVTREAIPTAKSFGTGSKNCKNGGTIKAGVCQCPYGFTGYKCETGCGKDRWGTSCEHECSSTDEGCRYALFCKGMNCTCASGYTGERCDTECIGGKYGSRCSLSCGKCSGGADCDPFTGDCPTTCLPGYIPPQCQHKYVQMTVGPTVTKVSYTEADIYAQMLMGNEVAGEGTPLYYVIQLKEGDGDWRSIKYMPILDWMIYDSVTGLKPGTGYEVRLILKTIDDNDYADEDIKSRPFNTTCLENNTLEILSPTVFNNGTIQVQWKVVPGDWRSCLVGEVELEVNTGTRWMSTRLQQGTQTAYFSHLLRDKTYMFRARPVIKHGFGQYSNTVRVLLDQGPGAILNLKASNVSSRSVLITWDHTSHEASTFNLTYKCVKILAGGNCEDEPGSVTVEKAPSMLLSGLAPHRKYLVALTRIVSFINQPSSQIEFTTRPEDPETIPRVSNVTVTNTTAHLLLSPPDDCSHCNGYLMGYRLWDPETNHTINVYDSKPIKYENLKPLSVYSVRLFLINTEGWHHDHYHTLNFTTLGAVPTQVMDLSVYKRGRTEVGLRWAAPLETHGTLGRFDIVYAEKSHSQAPIPCISWPDMFCFTVANLKPDAVYNFSVSARNKEFGESGPPSFVLATTSESAPDAPENLRVVEAWDTRLVVEWNPPKYANGLIRTFLVKIEQIESFTAETCCRQYPKKEVEVHDEKQFYSIELNDLLPGSEYAVSVMAETVWYGPAATLYANTTFAESTSSLPMLINDTLNA